MEISKSSEFNQYSEVEGLLEDEEGPACCFGINFGFATPPRVHVNQGVQEVVCSIL
jgi:hypothetical protein